MWATALLRLVIHLLNLLWVNISIIVDIAALGSDLDLPSMGGYIDFISFHILRLPLPEMTTARNASIIKRGSMSFSWGKALAKTISPVGIPDTPKRYPKNITKGIPNRRGIMALFPTIFVRKPGAE